MTPPSSHDTTAVRKTPSSSSRHRSPNGFLTEFLSRRFLNFKKQVCPSEWRAAIESSSTVLAPVFIHSAKGGRPTFARLSGFAPRASSPPEPPGSPSPPAASPWPPAGSRGTLESRGRSESTGQTFAFPWIPACLRASLRVATKRDRKKFKVWDDTVWVVKDQDALDRQLARKGVELRLEDDPAVEMPEFDDIIPDDDELRDPKTYRYRARATKIAGGMGTSLH